jgi:hypothetical protein
MHGRGELRYAQKTPGRTKRINSATVVQRKSQALIFLASSLYQDKEEGKLQGEAAAFYREKEKI